MDFKALHSAQLKRIPQLYWEALYEKLRYEVYDAGDYFTMSPDSEGWKIMVSNQEGVQSGDPKFIFLIDHAWTYQPHRAREQLLAIPGLANRMTMLMDIYGMPNLVYDGDSTETSEESYGNDSDQSGGEEATSSPTPESPQPVQEIPAESTNQIAEAADDLLPSEDLVAKILEKMWKFCQAYNINNSLVPIWYIMDEFGSRIQHSDNPSVAMTTFFYIPSQVAFSVMWPLKDLKFGDEVTRNYLQMSVKPGLERACHFLPWSRDSHLTLDDQLWNQLGEFTVPEMQERCSEQLPEPTQEPLPLRSKYKVYTDIDLVKSFLNHPAFEISSLRQEADILWICEHFKEFRSLNSGQYVNQFPCENVLTCKDLLATVAKRASPQEVGVVKDCPKWLPQTFNLLYELPHFVRCYLEREEKAEDNVWIVKPWNLGRGLDIHISDNLTQVIRLAQAGPKVVSKYLTNPVLFDRPEVGLVKFDIRYVVMLMSVQPTVLYAYNVFWLRFANKPFSLSGYYDYEKHFTVMNYQEGAKLKQIHYDEFIVLFERQYPQYTWKETETKIFLMLKELFTSACSKEPPAGIAQCTQSRAIYAIDLMLEWDTTEVGSTSMQPKLLEVNFSPDCVRACKYHPNFFNHVFETLFLDSSSWRKDLPITRL